VNSGITYGNLPKGNVIVIYDFVYQIHLIACSNNVSGVNNYVERAYAMPCLMNALNKKSR